MSEVKVSSGNTHCLCRESGQVDGQLVITMVLGTCIGGNVLRNVLLGNPRSRRQLSYLPSPHHCLPPTPLYSTATTFQLGNASHN